MGTGNAKRSLGVDGGFCLESKGGGLDLDGGFGFGLAKHIVVFVGGRGKLGFDSGC